MHHQQLLLRESQRQENISTTRRPKPPWLVVAAFVGIIGFGLFIMVLRTRMFSAVAGQKM